MGFKSFVGATLRQVSISFHLTTVVISATDARKTVDSCDIVCLAIAALMSWAYFVVWFVGHLAAKSMYMYLNTELNSNYNFCGM